ncbi:magnesium-transporting ATPase (P-type) [Sporosarcina luteola]|nr:magnesium-transporting ATPase (P-type) [Sporosarcina luteola]
MKVSFYLSSIISGLITIGVFKLVNHLTAVFDPSRDLYGGGNGNPALFFLMVGGLFMSYFAFTVVLMFYSYHANKNRKEKLLLLSIYSVIAIFIFSKMSAKAIKLKNYINENHPYKEVGLFNQFSNNIYFNVWTFIGSIAVLAIVSFLIPHKNRV